ncbi:MAG: hypothetical protein EXX96DRAFT_540261 [Benjaminiella poitrasii]|nr:MAG: hypothetical protein EXX96DRAFT_540261 [Benjaminiella poitrasii]
MQQKRTRNPKSKLFQCTGYADCNMVFTRSEHLARHARKHTGEKPFKCIVPDCNKAFSRFDNMMQHTQTHRNHNYAVISNAAKKYYRKERGYNNRSRAQTKEVNTKNLLSVSSSCEVKESVPKEPISRLDLSNMTTSSSSFYSPSTCSSSFSDEEEEEEEDLPSLKQKNKMKKKRLSIADLCNPPTTASSTTNMLNLTKDEFEALEGFGRFRNLSSSVFFDSLRCLTSQDYC